MDVERGDVLDLSSIPLDNVCGICGIGLIGVLVDCILVLRVLELVLAMVDIAQIGLLLTGLLLSHLGDVLQFRGDELRSSSAPVECGESGLCRPALFTVGLALSLPSLLMSLPSRLSFLDGSILAGAQMLIVATPK